MMQTERGEPPIEWQVLPGEAGDRLDRWLLFRLTGRSRSSVQQLIHDGRVTVNGLSSKPGHPLKGGDRVCVDLELSPDTQLPTPADVPLTVVYEDEHLLVIDKPQGIAVHSSSGRETVTIAHALMSRGHALSNLSGEDRPGIVHRLDKHTSGLLLIAKTNEAHAKLGQDFRQRVIDKRYLAVANGSLAADEFVIDAPIGRNPRQRDRMAVIEAGTKNALTVVTAEERFRDFTLIVAKPHTGRTHQIRVHLAHIGHPIVGDHEYGGHGRARAAAEQRGDGELLSLVDELPGQLLHAVELQFDHPVTGERIELRCDPPPLFQSLVSHLRNRHGVG